jgi:uncharacterized protein YbbC (DUF1343 family)
MLVGLDVLKRGRNSSARRRLQDQKVGLLTHAAAVDENGEQTLKVLRGLGIEPVVVFSPEHGLDGLAQAEEAVGEDRADVGDTRLVSLYGTTKESLAPKASDLEGLDVLVIDLVDVGSRYYTYVWTALLAARAAADADVHTLVLDRPNPIGGDPSRIEGRPQNEELRSFVGLESIPIRHSMTIAEILASQFNQEDRSLGRDGALSVVATEGWERFRQASAHGRPFVPPSPNMPTSETALVYPGGCLLEATNLSEGRGTTTPFQLVGAPFLKAQQFAERLIDLPGLWVRPTRFKPTFDKHQGSVCEGVMLHVANEAVFRPVETYLTIIAEARRQAPEEFKLLSRVYEFESEHCAFDLLTGCQEARELLEAGAENRELIELLCPVDEEWKVRIEAAEELLDEVRA